MSKVIRNLWSTGWVVLACVAIGTPPAARAAAPMAHTPAPGYYRMMLGKFQVTALSCGVFRMPVKKLLRGISPAALDKALAAHFETSIVPTSVNAFLVNTGSRLVLIDTGPGGFSDTSEGQVIRSLKASGYQPSQVDDVLITHMHPDHIGGLLDHGRMAFPHATVWVNKKEADYWLNPANMATAPKRRQDNFRDAMLAIKPYKQAGHFRTYTGSRDILPGIRTLPEPGHTPGHSGYLVSSGGHTMLAWGDIIHVQAVQFRDPSVTITYDSNQAEARATRLKVLARVAAHKDLVAGAHLSFPGLGHVRKDRRGYTWVPVPYTVPK